MKINRYKNYNEANNTLDAYLDGAKYGVVGHFTNYPLYSKNMMGNPIDVLKTGLDLSNISGMYIHWPFCYLPFGIEKCDFCMCNTKNDTESVSLRNEYFQSILKEIELYSSFMQNSVLEWVYIGGGTPLTMSALELDQLFTLMKEKRLVNKDTYISIESRPEVITEKKVNVLKKHHVKRISIGVESFNEKTLVEMGRIRSGLNYYEIVQKAVSMIENAGIPYFNLDFLYSHPNDDFETVLDSIEKGIDFLPNSFAIYPLGLPYNRTEIEKNIGELELKPLDFRYKCYVAINELLEKNGYKAVSDSIWSKDDMYSHKSVTNKDNSILNFWNQTCSFPDGNWMPVGVGSIGFIEGFGSVSNTYSMSQYIELIAQGKLGIVKGEQNSIEQLMRGFLVISILHRIIDIDNFTEKFGYNPLEVFNIEFNILKQKELVDISNNEIILTPKAIPLSQGIARFFLSKDDEELYRKSEQLRVDYKFYNVSYQGLK
ncbi:coproporphyrinogen-III oxidase family protein [Paenibacillus solani]|uniref:coproporphyrinogen-III oxidase family protein n=1 Tax=Paenibacillus solani TaxID=1705565 RepID=UPI003D290D3B